jgi:hypothetical protein
MPRYLTKGGVPIRSGSIDESPTSNADPAGKCTLVSFPLYSPLEANQRFPNGLMYDTGNGPPAETEIPALASVPGVLCERALNDLQSGVADAATRLSLELSEFDEGALSTQANIIPATSATASQSVPRGHEPTEHEDVRDAISVAPKRRGRSARATAQKPESFAWTVRATNALLVARFVTLSDRFKGTRISQQLADAWEMVAAETSRERRLLVKPIQCKSKVTCVANYLSMRIPAVVV